MSRSPCAPQKEHPTTPDLREALAGGGRLERRPAPIPQGQAVTAGRGPRSHTKAAGRRFLMNAQHKTGPLFSLESRPVSFSAEKEMDLAPAAGSRTPGGRRPANPRRPQAAPTARRVWEAAPHIKQSGAPQSNLFPAGSRTPEGGRPPPSSERRPEHCSA